MRGEEYGVIVRGNDSRRHGEGAQAPRGHPALSYNFLDGHVGLWPPAMTHIWPPPWRMTFPKTPTKVYNVRKRTTPSISLSRS